MPDATFIVDRLEQPDNALPPIFVVLAGIEIADRFEQFAKALSPIVVTPDGIAIVDRLEQPENAPLPILLIPVDIAILDNARQLLKVDAGIEDIEACMLTDPRDVQPENTPLPMLETLPGTVTLVNAVQFANALSPMLRTLPGMDTLLIGFPWKAPAPIAVTSEGIVTAPPPPLYAVSTPLLIVIFAVFEANTRWFGIKNITNAAANSTANPRFAFELFICVTPSSQ